jgi:thymidylate synthase ThyX
VGVHKQIANRLLEPFMYHTVIVTSTEWDNFFEQRLSPHAQPEIRELAEAMRDAMAASEPSKLKFGQWHLPLVDEEEGLSQEDAILASVARIAAVSYGREDVQDLEKERKRFELLSTNKHLSPFEHVARISLLDDEWANLKGWQQARWFIERNQLKELMECASALT